MRRGLLVVAAAAALIAVPAAYALLSQHGVKTTRLYEQLPAATEGSTQYVAWSQNSRAHRNHDPPMVAYQQVVNGNSDLKLYDADAQTRTDPPAGVNTFDWEWEPSISGDWLLFARRAARSSSSSAASRPRPRSSSTRARASATQAR